jgi:hypothetical protein
VSAPSSTPPINFLELVKTGGDPANGGYPYQLKASDLQKNFTYATEDFSADHFLVTTMGSGQGGNTQRRVKLKLAIPTLPTTGTHVLGAVNGTLQWIATEEC